VFLENAKACFERIKQRLRHLGALARLKHLLSDCTLVSDLDCQFSDLPVGLRKIFLSLIHGFARTLAVSFDLDYLLIHDTRMNLLSARSLTLEPYEPSLPWRSSRRPWTFITR
jgi:hypothetical protein